MDAHYLVCKKLLEDNASIRIRSTWAPDARRRIQPQETTRKEIDALFHENLIGWIAVGDVHMIKTPEDINRILTSTAKWTPWNPVTGCTKISDACKNCYAEATSLFLMQRGITAYINGFLPTFHDDRIHDLAKLRQPRRIFLTAMSDLFHDNFSDTQIASVISAVYLHPQHSYFIVTKRPERMYSFMLNMPHHQNLCLGVTVESDAYSWRAEYLADLQDRFITFVNCEPLLGHIGSLPTAGIDICFAAPEAGPHRRPSAPEWFTSLEHYCNSHNIRYIGHRFDIRADAGKRPIYP